MDFSTPSCLLEVKTVTLRRFAERGLGVESRYVHFSSLFNKVKSLHRPWCGHSLVARNGNFLLPSVLRLVWEKSTSTTFFCKVYACEFRRCTDCAFTGRRTNSGRSTL
jgi:hypothetical protein